MNNLKGIEKGQEVLYELIAKNGLNNEDVYKQSCLLDRLILQYTRAHLLDKERV